MQSEWFEPVTVAEIRALVASIYEPQPRIWSQNRWECPNCGNQNACSVLECGCGISRDGLPEFCERDNSKNQMTPTDANGTGLSAGPAEEVLPFWPLRRFNHWPHS
jgi:hypothetical protein